MKKRILLFGLLLSSALPGYSQWAVDTLPVAKMHLGAVTFQDKIYFIGGEYYSNETSEVSVFNCITSSWDSSMNISNSRSLTTCISGDSGIYVLGGRLWDYGYGWARYYNGSRRIDIFKNGAWQTDSISIPDPVWGGRALKVGSRLLFTGFVDSIDYITSDIYASKKVYIFDESTGTWSTDSLSSPRTELGAATDGTIALFAGGVNGLGIVSDVVDIYNSVSNTWTTSSLSVARACLGATYANGKFYFAGGELGGIISYPSDVVDVYDGSGWSTMQLSVPRAKVEVAAINDEVYFMGGCNVDLNFLPFPDGRPAFSTVDVLNTSQGDWSRKDFNTPHANFACATWGNKIFAAGGGLKSWCQGSPCGPSYMFEMEIRDVTLGMEDLPGKISMEVYPNPSAGGFTILLPEDQAEIRITDIVGQEIMYTKTTDRLTNLQLEINGIYFVMVKTKNGTATRKIIISN